MYGSQFSHQSVHRTDWCYAKEGVLMNPPLNQTRTITTSPSSPAWRDGFDPQSALSSVWIPLWSFCLSSYGSILFLQLRVSIRICPSSEVCATRPSTFLLLLVSSLLFVASFSWGSILLVLIIPSPSSWGKNRTWHWTLLKSYPRDCFPRRTSAF